VVADAAGRHVWVVTWGRPGRVDWKAVLALAYDPDHALALARRRFPDLRPPDAAVLAAAATARSVLAGEAVANMEVVSEDDGRP
jgi:hypothetical protein